MPHTGATAAGEKSLASAAIVFSLGSIDLASLRSSGYAFQVELTYRAVCAGFRVEEIPITFHDRVHGSSKMSWRIAVEAARVIPQLRHDAGPAGEPAPLRVARSV